MRRACYPLSLFSFLQIPRASGLWVKGAPRLRWRACQWKCLHVYADIRLHERSSYVPFGTYAYKLMYSFVYSSPYIKDPRPSDPGTTGTMFHGCNSRRRGTRHLTLKEACDRLGRRYSRSRLYRVSNPPIFKSAGADDTQEVSAAPSFSTATCPAHLSPQPMWRSAGRSLPAHLFEFRFLGEPQTKAK